MYLVSEENGSIVRRRTRAFANTTGLALLSRHVRCTQHAKHERFSFPMENRTGGPNLPQSRTRAHALTHKPDDGCSALQRRNQLNELLYPRFEALHLRTLAG